MKKYLPFIIGVLGAIVSATLIYFRKYLGDTSTIKTFAQITLPIILAAVFAFVPGTMKQKFSRLGLMLGSFFIILSALSPFAFKYWVTYVTPAGDTYTRYDLDSLYPVIGIFIVLIAWVVGLVLVLLQDVYRRVLRIRTKQQS